MIKRIHTVLNGAPGISSFYFDENGQVYSEFNLISNKLNIKLTDKAHKDKYAVIPEPWMIDRFASEFYEMLEADLLYSVVESFVVQTFAADLFSVCFMIISSHK